MLVRQVARDLGGEPARPAPASGGREPETADAFVETADAFVDFHAKRLADMAGVETWEQMDGETRDHYASQVHDVLNNLRCDEYGRVTDGRATPATAEREG